MPGISFKVLPAFPPQITGVAPIVVVKSGLTYAISYASGFAAPALLASKANGDTNNSASGSGSDFDHNLRHTIPANFLVSGRVIRVTAHYQLTTGSAPPGLITKLKLGTIELFASPSLAAGVSMTNKQTAFQWVFQATGPPGAAVNVQCSPIGHINAVEATTVSQTAMPVLIATNAAQEVRASTRWAAVGTGTTTISLNQFIVESLN